MSDPKLLKQFLIKFVEVHWKWIYKNLSQQVFINRIMKLSWISQAMDTEIIINENDISKLFRECFYNKTQ